MNDLFTQITGMEQAPPRERVLLLTNAFVLSQCVFTATELGIADLLDTGAQSCDELAIQTQTHRDTLYRLLRLLADLGIFAETEPGIFQNTPMSECLQDKTTPGVVRNFVLLRAKETLPWTNLSYSVRTGQSAFEQMYGMSRYTYLRQNPKLNQLFNQAMGDLTTIHNSVVLAGYDFSSAQSITDIGGGRGSLLAAILEKYPHMRGLLLEQDGVIEEAQQFLQNKGVLARCQLVGGDFFHQIPAGGDIYLLKHVLHNWDDSQALRILQACRQVMSGSETLLIIERVMPIDSSLRNKMLDLNMLVMLAAGKLRSEAEFKDILRQADFRLQRVIATESELGIIEAVPER